MGTCPRPGLQGAPCLAASQPAADTRGWLVWVSGGEGKVQGGLLRGIGASVSPRALPREGGWWGTFLLTWCWDTEGQRRGVLPASPP